jgi:hypothetical protein
MRLIKRPYIPQLLLHLAACAVLLALPLLFSPESLNVHSYLANPPTQRDLIAYVLALGVFYVNFFFLIPAYYFTHKYALYVFFNLIAFAAITFLPNILIHPAWPAIAAGGPPPNFRRINAPPPLSGPPPAQFVPGSTPPAQFAPGPPPQPGPAAPTRNLFFDISRHLFLFLAAVIFALLLRIRDRWKAAEEERTHAELSYLKAQINPHFLFNTLNTIYALALERSDKTPAAITRLSSMMRYVLLEAGKGVVPLEHELTYLSDYVTLQQARFDGALQVDFTVTGDPGRKMIAPVLLIPFIENAFKHGVNPEFPALIRIRVEIGPRDLHLRVSNQKVATRIPDSYPGGLGIRNTRQRLGIFYPSRYRLNIEDNDTVFTVDLTLQLT